MSAPSVAFPFSGQPKRSWSVMVDPPNIGAGAMVAVDVTLNGLRRGHVPLVTMPNLEPGITLTYRVKDVNTLEIRLHNTTGAAINPANQRLYAYAL